MTDVAMTEVALKPFEVGTTGWSIDDLDDPEIEARWCEGRYEISDGVLTKMPPAMYDGGMALKRLVRIIENHTVAIGLGDGFSFEVDLILNDLRLPVADAVFLTREEQAKQKQLKAARPRGQGRGRRARYGRILVPPTLVVESISEGHERRDRETKRRWYAEAHIPNYWLLDAQQRSLDCLVLDGADYRLDQSGRDDAELRPSLFPGLTLPLGQLWAE